MNALFYNLNTKEVEDLTQRGLADLAAGMLTSEDLSSSAY
jgi:tRNA nucleotidyltransferase/poly(A) polymerase